MKDPRETIESAIPPGFPMDFATRRLLAEDILAALAEGGWTICTEEVVDLPDVNGWPTAHGVVRFVPVYRGAVQP